MHIVMIGTGYVGLVTGTCLAELGCHVTCVDKDSSKIAKLKKGIIPIFEPGLEELVIRNHERGKLAFSDNLAEETANADVIFLAVGTPTNEADGSADLSFLFGAVEEIARSVTKPCVIVTKSTVPVGTGKRIAAKLAELCPHPCDVVSNPEFLREGSAVRDFMEPDRIIVGTTTGNAREVVRTLYWNLIDRNVPIHFTDIETSELIKYASNAFLATKIAFINEMADVCEKLGANVDDVARGMGMDPRIGGLYLQPGPGFGGSCFPKDTLALAHIARGAGTTSHVVESVIASNDARKTQLAEKVIAAAGGSVRGQTIAILGTAFKANTDDMRESASLVLLPALLEAGASIRAYDPQAMEEAKKLLKGDIAWGCDPYETLQGADFLVILTEWKEFKELNLERVKNSLRTPCIVDFRNLFNPDEMVRAGLRYVSVGRPSAD
ncbi:MAG: UDP-glucose 6-dehydrogenase [Rickettsiales bacterium]|jgi:UDPglucose 6-dehydrogenase|nr:UDP-glucose 6-dehydrogenase [Rickettsiales bacterium]